VSSAATSPALSAVASLRPGSFAPRRTVEVRIVVAGHEEDAFAVSHADTLIRVLALMLKHLDNPATIKLSGVERAAVPLDSSRRSVQLADLDEAIAFLRHEAPRRRVAE
jgi:hypothetical protein